MAKVEMSLQEYNQMKEELDMYKEIVNALTTPRQDVWDIKYFKENSDSNLYVNICTFDHLPLKCRDLLKKNIITGIETYMEFNDIEGEVDYNYDNLSAVIKHIKKEEEVPQEDFFIPEQGY